DAAGVKVLIENKVPTPGILYQGVSEDKRIQVVLLERIFDSQNLEELWLDRQSLDELLPVMQAVMTELATQHVLGLMQNDAHLKNFLATEKHIYTLDGDQIQRFPEMLNKKTSMQNLALFLAQLGVGLDAYQEKLFLYYAKLRGWLLKLEDRTFLFLEIKKCNEQRWQRFEKKIFRDCTDFVSLHKWKAHGMYNRQYTGPEFLAFLQHPDALIDQVEGANLLKAGRSSTVVKVELDRRTLVIKRYNMKNMLHRIRRCLRPTRALVSWRLAQKMRLFGVRTAKPVAFIENKYLGFRGKSYYVTEYIPGMDIGEYFTAHRDDKSLVSAMVTKVSVLLKSLLKLEITHGDLKSTNILIDEKARPVFIDLDGANEHLSLSGLRSAWHKEIKRFLRNFKGDIELQEKLKNELI
ncbi:MAG: lipopolysaccharide kinase InaA family protein, partial [Gammaproteobacteria bacterium]